jgi:hypothetical protein
MPANGDAKRFLIPLVSVLFLTLYLAGTSEIYTYADDSLPYVAHVLADPKVVVHHLILTVFHEATHWVGLTTLDDFVKTLWLFKAYVACTGALTLFLVGTLFRSWFGSLELSVATMTFVGLSYGFWAYSIVPDVYVPAVAFVLLAVFWADRSCEAPGKAKSYGFLALTSISVLLAVLNHQSHGLVAVPIALILLLGRASELPVSLRVRRTAFFTLLTGTLGFAMFFVSYLAAASEHDFITYLRGYSAWMKMMPYDSIQPLTPFYVLLGVSRALVFPEFALRFDQIYESVEDHFRLKLLLDERYLLRGMPELVAGFLSLANAAILLTLAVFVCRGAIAVIRRPSRSAGIWMIALWIPIQALFFSLWESTSNEFWIWLVPGIGFVAAAGVTSWTRSSTRKVFSVFPFLLVLLAVNSSVISKYWSEENCIYRVNKRYLTQLRAEDLVLGAYTYPRSKLVHLRPCAAEIYEFMLGSFTLDDPELAPRLERVESAGGKIYLDPILSMSHASESALMAYQTGKDRAAVERELLRLEAFAQARGIPVVAVERKASAGIEFERPSFAGYVEWSSGP